MRINGKNFVIELVDDLKIDNEQLLGLCDKDKYHIFILKTENKDSLYSTIKHEITHAYIYAYGFDQVNFTEEIVCDFMEAYGEQIIKDAKKAYKNLRKEK